MLQVPCDTKHDLPFVITVEPTSEHAVREAVDGDGAARFPAGAAAGAADGAAVMKKRVSGFALLFCASALCGQVATDANERYQTPEGRESLARTLSAADRDQKQKPKDLVAAMSLKPGMTLADIGTGVGYMLPYLSGAVGPGGSVLSEDIFADFLERPEHCKRAQAHEC